MIGGLKQSASETNGKFACNTQNTENQIIRSSKHFRIVFVSLSELKFWLSWTSTKNKLYLPVLLVLGLKRHVLCFVQYNRLLMISESETYLSLLDRAPVSVCCIPRFSENNQSLSPQVILPSNDSPLFIRQRITGIIKSRYFIKNLLRSTSVLIKSSEDNVTRVTSRNGMS